MAKKTITQTSAKGATHSSWQAALAVWIASAVFVALEKLGIDATGIDKQMIVGGAAAAVGWVASYAKSSLVSKQQQLDSDFGDIGF